MPQSVQIIFSIIYLASSSSSSYAYMILSLRLPLNTKTPSSVSGFIEIFGSACDYVNCIFTAATSSFSGVAAVYTIVYHIIIEPEVNKLKFRLGEIQNLVGY
jgi:hypothetical protein